MDNTQTSVDFEITSAIRSDEILLCSEDNIWANAVLEGTAARSSVQFYMLNFHRERMLNAAKAFHWDTSPLEGPKAFSDLLEMLHDHLECKYHDRNYAAPLKIRIAYSANGRFTITSNGPHPGPASIERPLALLQDDPVSELYPRSLSSIAGNPAYLRWRVAVSPNKVTKSLFTTHKTSHRREYDKALALAPLAFNDDRSQTEVLLVNDNEEVMEGCISTPYFKRGGDWITPQASCGGNIGTTRRWALERGLCKVGVVQIGSVQKGGIIVLSNGAKGFQSGFIFNGESLDWQLVKGKSQGGGILGSTALIHMRSGIKSRNKRNPRC